MEFSSLKPKKLLIFKEGILKIWKRNKKSLLKVVSDDVFSIFATVEHREIPCEANVM